MEHRWASRLGEWIVLAVFLGIAGLIFQQIVTSLAVQGAASGDPLSNAAMFPRMVAWLMLALVVMIGAAMLAGRIVRPGDHHTADAAPDLPPESASLRGRMLAGMIAILLLYLLALERLGFHIATSAAMIAMFAVLGVRPLWFAMLCGVGLSLLVGFVFEGVLNVVLPTGMFDLALPLGVF